MADTLRDLVVNLSLNSDNFSRNIASVNKEIKEAESYFKMLGAGVQGFEGTQAGAAARVELLNRQIELGRQAVEQYERKLATAQATLE
ncbi:MAG: hypothetical protein IKE30_06450, partial [Clostridia bacterium]|nr:hypothetical protein [Clostridia bacterium]